MPYKNPEVKKAYANKRARAYRARNREKCNKATRDYMRRTYAIPEVKARRLAANKAWQLRNPERVKELQRARNLKRKFDITTEQYDFMFKHQHGVCGLCHRPPKNDRRMAVDHDHNTGQIRGLLCDGCNRMLGRVEARWSMFDMYFYFNGRYGMRADGNPVGTWD